MRASGLVEAKYKRKGTTTPAPLSSIEEEEDEESERDHVEVKF